VVNRQQLLFTEAWRHSKFGSRLCKIRGAKHPRAFVIVVESSEIYNFHIHHLVHFYSNFRGFKRSNRGTVARSQDSRRLAATSRAERACARAPVARAAPRAGCHPRLSGPRAPSRGRRAIRDRAIRDRAPRGLAPRVAWGSCPRHDVPATYVPNPVLVCATRVPATY
jgi:hypothetical protein